MSLDTEVQELTAAAVDLFDAVTLTKNSADQIIATVAGQVDLAAQSAAAAEAAQLDIQTNWQDKLLAASLAASTATSQAGDALASAAAALASAEAAEVNASSVSVGVLAATSLLTGQPASDKTLITLGYRAAGDGGGGVWRWDALEANDNDELGGVIVKPAGHSGSGRWVRVGAYTEPANPLWWGAYRDNTNAALTRAAIQSAIDWAIYQFKTNFVGSVGLGRVYIPGGRYSVDRSIMVGYPKPNDYRSCFIFGDGPRYAVGGAFNGTAITATFGDAPVFAVNGARGTTIANMSIRGINYNWINTNGLGRINAPAVDDRAIANWVDPLLPASASSRYAPYCGVAVDPYCGVKPGVAYPDVVYPSWTGITTQYGGGISTAVFLDAVEISGFVVGVANKPCNDQNNGDFTKIRRSTITHCQYIVSIGNGQSRLFHIEDSGFNIFHTGIATGAHGLRGGKPNIRVCSTQFANCTKWFDIPNSDLGGSPVFEDCYGELVYSIGNYGQNAQSATPLTLKRCAISFDDSWATRGVPAVILSNASSAQVHLEACEFNGGDHWMSLAFYQAVGATLGFVNCSFQYSSSSTPSTAVQYATKAVLGAPVGGLTAIGPSDWKNNRLPAYAWVAGIKNLCMWNRVGACPNYNDAGVPINYQPYSQSKASASLEVVGQLVTLTLTGQTAAILVQRARSVGDVWFDQATGMVFVVISVVQDGSVSTTYRITLQAMTGFDGAGNLSPSFIKNSGVFWCIHGRAFFLDAIAGVMLYGDSTAGSATFGSIATDGGSSGPAGSEYTTINLSPNDYVMVDPSAVEPVAQSSSRITAVTSNSFTTVGNWKRTENRRRLPIFVKAPPANEPL